MQEYETIKSKLLENKKLNLSENIVIEFKNYFYKVPNPIVKNIIYKNENSYEYLILSHKIIKNHFEDICNIAETEILKDDFF
jgi:hypothetical protein